MWPLLKQCVGSLDLLDLNSDEFDVFFSGDVQKISFEVSFKELYASSNSLNKDKRPVSFKAEKQEDVQLCQVGLDSFPLFFFFFKAYFLVSFP